MQDNYKKDALGHKQTKTRIKYKNKINILFCHVRQHHVYKLVESFEPTHNFPITFHDDMNL